MKKFYSFLTQTLLCLLLTVSAKAINIPVNTITAPDTLIACDTNTFSFSFTLTAPSVLSISDSINFGGFSTCHGNGGDDFAALKLFKPSGQSFYHDTVNHTWNIHLSAGTDTISFYVFIDCGIIPPDTSLLQNLSFIQTWTDSSNSSINYQFSGLNYLSLPLIAPSLIDVSPQQFYGNYLDTVSIYFRYFNFSKANAHIRFKFNPDQPGNCQSLSLIALEYAIGDTSSLIYQPLDTAIWNLALIAKSEAIVIRKTVRITGCRMPCNPEAADFRWKCNYTDTIIPFCDKCQNDYSTRKYAVLEKVSDTLGVTVKLVQPSLQMAKFDTSCMNSKVQWEYHIVNGKRNVPSARIDLYDGSPIFYSGWGPSYLTLIDSTSLVIDQYCSGCVTDTSIWYNTTALCSDSIQNPMGKVVINLRNFMKGDSVVVRYQTYRCCEENDSSLLNEYKYYNRWQLAAMVKDTCGDSLSVNAQMSSNVNVAKADFDQDLQFSPSVSDLTVPKDSIFGPATPLLNVKLKGMVWDSTGYQFMGCASDSPSVCTLNGYLRARIHCQKGLLVDTPLTHVSITGFVAGVSVTWNPVSYYTNIPTGVCDSGDFYYFFPLSNPNAISLLSVGSLDFRLRSCCYSGLPKSLYDVAFHLIAFPSSGCDSCALPMSSTGDGISIHCPGCVSPGIIVDNYRIQRISFGVRDSNNNRKADVPNTLITQNSAYYNTYGNQMNTVTAHHSDIVEDHMVAHFQKGDPDDSGYTYVQMLDSNVVLKYLQMERTFLIGTDSVQINLTPYYMKLYIDTLAAPADTNCIDCFEYDSLDMDYRTVHIIADSGTSLNSTYIQTDTSRHSIFFTFGAADTSGNLFDHIVFSDSLKPFYGFGESQRYRLLVRYRVCGFFFPPDTSNDFIPENNFKKAEIINDMFLSGLPHGTNASSTIPLAPQYGPLPSPLTQVFADSALFRCVTFGGRFYFYSDVGLNGSKFENVNNNKCNKKISVTGSVRTGLASAINDIYPFEYRLSSFEPYQFIIRIPPGYTVTQANYTSTYYLQNGSQIPVPRILALQQPLNDTLIIYADSLLSITCLDENSPGIFPDSNLYINEDIRIENLSIPLQAMSCNPDSFYVPQITDVVIRYRDNTLQCADSITQGCEPVFFDRYMPPYQDTLRLPKPLLTMTMSPEQTDGYANRVCWTFELENDFDNAYNVFITPPLLSNLTNWTIFINNQNGVTLYPDSNGIFEVDSIMSSNYFTQTDSLCATFVNCHVDTPIYLTYGWNCNGIPASANETVCFKDSIQLTLTPTLSSLFPSPYTPPSTFDLCKPFTIAASYQSKSQGYLYPNQFSINSLDPNLQVNGVYMFSCGDSLDSITLTPSGIPYTWNITAADLDSIDIKDSSLSANECIFIEVIVTPLCGSDTIIPLPSLDLTALTYCGETKTSSAEFDTITSGVPYSGISYCDDCFTLTKTALQDSVAAGDTVNFEIIICGNNADSIMVNLTEYLPSDFDTLPGSVIQDSVFVPAQGCDTIIISGVFNTPGSCSDPAHINRVQITNSNIDTTASACVTVLDSCFAMADSIFADSTFSSFYPATLSNITIYVAGRFYVNTHFTLINCTVYTNAGAQIIVMPPYIFTLDSATDISGCTNMWQGIVLESESHFQEFNNSRVRDAECGIYANQYTTFTVENSDVTECVVGIYTPLDTAYHSITGRVEGSRFGMWNSTSFKPDYTGQPYHGLTPQAGMELNNMVMIIGSSSASKNQFNRMNTGITGIGSVIRVINSEFIQMQEDTAYHVPYGGTAVVSDGSTSVTTAMLTFNPLAGGDTTVVSCKRGVYTMFSAATISNLLMTGVQTGVYSTKCSNPILTTSVTGCIIFASKRGIDFYLNAGTGGMTAIDNFIYMNVQKSIGISMQESSNTINADYFISCNYVENTGGSSGIYAANLLHPAISQNTVHFSSGANFAIQGISLNACDSAAVAYNTIKSTTVTDTMKIGMHVSLSDNSYIGCNSVDSIGWGVFFTGLCPGTEFKDNSMNDHYEGLRLSGSAVIDFQQLKGNTWSGTYGSGFGAVNLNSLTALDVALNEIRVQDTFPGTIYHPYNFLICSGCQWFVFLPGSPESCASPTVCNEEDFRGGGEGEASQLDMMIAHDSISTVDYEPEAQSMAVQYLFDKITDYDSLQITEPDLAEFYEDWSGSEKDYLKNIKNRFLAITSYSEEFEILYNAVDSLMDTLTVQFQFNNEQIMSGNPDSLLLIEENEEIILEINAAQQTLDSLIQQHRAFEELQLDTILSLNNQIETVEVIALNEKTVNELYITGFTGNGSLSSSEIEILYFIASQCPVAGGQAVYRARTLYAYFNDTIEYDDLNICLQQGYFRTKGIEKGSKFVTYSYVKPNPVDDAATLVYNIPESEICKFQIADVMGRIVFTIPLDCTQTEFEFTTSGMNSGMYIYKIVNSGKVIEKGKFAINR